MQDQINHHAKKIILTCCGQQSHKAWNGGVHVLLDSYYSSLVFSVLGIQMFHVTNATDRCTMKKLKGLISDFIHSSATTVIIHLK